MSATDRLEVHFDLDVQLETPRQPWRATLVRAGEARLEFESPLELARYLANLREPGSMGEPRRDSLR